MRIAHLVLCHAYPDQLKRLVGRLSHPDAHVYIHLDKKSNISYFRALRNMPGVFFIKNRVDVHWAGYSQVRSTLNSFREILAAGHYDYINLLSGQDYPITGADRIHDFLRRHPGKAYMCALSVYDQWREAIPRLTRYHLADYTFTGKAFAERMINSMLPQRKMPVGITPVGRSTWFTISGGSASYILKYVDEHPSFERFFKWCWGADELFFQTILYNSPLREVMVDDDLRYIDWSAGGANPKTLTMADAGAIITSGKLFARKFNQDTDIKILDYLDTAAAAK